jgi:riboflavin synthase alpha subunit
MFSGIVAGTGRCVSLQRSRGGALLTVEAPGILDGVEDGESVAVAGVCLTAVRGSAPGTVAFDLMPETLRRSTLGGLRPAAR